MSLDRSISRRDFLRAAAAVGASIVAAACAPQATPAPQSQPTSASGQATEPTAAAAPAPAEATTISYWHIWGGDRVDQLQQVLDQFMVENPAIKVEPLLLPNPGYADKIITALAGDAPDLTMVYTDEFAPSARRNALLAVDERMDKDGLSQDVWYPGVWAMSQWQGKTFGLPFVGNFLQMLYWNTDDLEAAGLDAEKGPETWAELTELASKLTETNDDGTIKRLGYQPMGMGDWVQAAYHNGLNLLGDGTPETIAINDAKSVEALQAVVEWYDVQGGYDAVGAALTGWGNQQLGNPMIAGVTSCIRSGVFTVNVINQQKPDLPYRIGKVPYGPQGEFVDLIEAAWCNCIPAKAKHPDQAWELAKYLSAGDGHLKFMVDMQSRPAMVKEYNEAPYDEAARAGNPYWDIVLEILNGKQVSYPVSDKLTPYVKLMTEAFDSVMLQQRTPEEAANWAQEEVVKAFQEA